ncbi:hypothetical protein Bhyg_11026 [Pseudolycoriella hygida]|uniref:Uncharacterized protein n=1 Tax=Pseudolycoriella hygida TaxID=35572 RepID=A0A9Q0MXA9_9DIPT|nr:hypothetical protein Bhyg_11026 [Pseudolycoriella hygida]
MVVSNVVLNALKNTPSCSEIYKCSRERCKYSCTRILPFLCVNTDTFKNDFGNLKLPIFMNFPDNEPKCTLCKTSTCITRTFGDHLFIEIPVAKYGHQHENNFEVINEVKLEDLPVSLEFFEKTYALWLCTNRQR